jgi:predicted transcriptional regulator
MPTSTKTTVPVKRAKNAKTATPPTPKPTTPATYAAPASTPPALPPAALTVARLLSAETGASIAELAGKAGLSRTTASKALTSLESAGRARRDDGARAGAHRAPDQWFAAARTDDAQSATADPDDATPPVDVVAEPEPVMETSEEPEAQADSDDATPPVEVVVDPEPVPEVSVEPEAQADPQPESADGEPDVPSGGQVQDEPAPAPPAEPANAPDPQPAASATPRQAKPAKKTPATPAPPATTPGGEERRLPKGGLRTMVAEHLEGNPELVITASKLGKLLDRSSGAVANALDKLIELGAVEQVGEKPRTFRHRTPNVAA